MQLRFFKYRKKCVSLFIVLGMILCLCSGCGEETYRTIAVLNVQGSSIVNRKGEENAVYGGMHLYSGDAVSVKANSHLTLQVDLDKYLFAQENTEFYVEADGDEDCGITKIRLEDGSILTRIEEKLVEGESFQVETPRSIMSVRGTVFRVSYSKDAEGEDLVTTQVFQGAVQTNLRDFDGHETGESAVFPAGTQGVVVSKQEKENHAFFLTDNDDQAAQKIEYDALPKEVAVQLVVLIDDGAELDIERDELINLHKITENEVSTAKKESSFSDHTPNNENGNNSTTDTSETNSTIDSTNESSHVTPETETDGIVKPTESTQHLETTEVPETTAATVMTEPSVTTEEIEPSTAADTNETSSETLEASDSTSPSDDLESQQPTPTTPVEHDSSHHVEEHIVRAASCTRTGIKSLYCTVCQKEIGREEIPLIAHQFGAWGTERETSCISNGLEVRTCALCGHKESWTIPAKGHNFNSKWNFNSTNHWHDCTACSFKGDLTAHTFGEWTEEKAATCDASGTKVRSCNVCGRTERVEIPAKGHQYGEWVVKTPAACTAPGEEIHTCSECSKTESQVIPAKGHQYGEWVVKTPAACTASGEEIHTCSECSKTESRVIPAKGHQYGEWVVKLPATCTAPGEETHICSACQKTERRAIPQKEHNFATGWATDVQNHWHECTACGFKSEPTAHVFEAWKVEIAATCEAKGYQIHSCETCGYTERQEIPAIGHQYGEWVVKTPATCTASGEETHTCTRCQKTESRVIAQLSHSFGTKWTTDGKNHWHECTACGLKSDLSVHTFGAWTEEKTATCEVSGTKVRSCEVCGYTERQVIPATGHSYGEWVTTKAATCTAPGEKTHTCTRCQKTESRAISQLAHSFGTKWTTDGKNHWHECTACGLKSDLSVHTFGAWTEEKAATCEVSGTKAHSCEVCGYTERQAIPATGHSYGEWVTIKAATCTAPGSESHTCSVCQKTESRAISQKEHNFATGWATDLQNHWHECTACGFKSEPVAHVFGTWKVEIAATCEAKGYQIHSCETCGYTERQEIPAMDHQYGEWVVKTPATCTAPGEETRTCTRCQKTESRVIAQLSHSFDTKWLTDSGNHWHECTACGLKRDVAVHSYGEWTVDTPATCYLTGKRSHVCSVCGHKEIEVIPMTGHSFRDWVITISPNCTNTGEKTRECLICGYVETAIIPAKGHTFSTIWSTDGENHWHECTACGLKRDIAGHSYGEWTVDTPATCYLTGNRSHVCSICGYKETEEIPMVGHSFRDWVITISPNCTNPGEKTRECPICGYVETAIIPAEGHKLSAIWSTDGENHWHECSCGAKSDVAAHTYGAWTETKAATCTTTGSKTHSCTVCGKTETETIAKLPHSFGTEWKTDGENHWHECTVCSIKSDVAAHTYGAWTETKAATCTTTGSKTHSCTVCGKTETETIAKLPHSFGTEWKTDGENHWHECSCGAKSDVAAHTYGAWTVTEAATCTTTGSQTHSCTVCGKTETETIAKLPHSYGTIWKTDGKNHWHECAVCGLKSELSVHTFSKWTEEKAATCEESGTKVHSCNVCGYTERQEIPATDHHYGEWVVKTPATCKAPGEEIHTCSVCKKTESHAIPQKEHDFPTGWVADAQHHWHECTACGVKSKPGAHVFGAWKVEIAATCEAKGYQIHSCETCGYTERQETPAVGHKYGDWVVTRAATCTAPGEETHICSECKKTESQEIPQLAHSYGTVWKTDGKNHWHECICGAKSDVAAHTYGDWTETKAATCTTTGSQTHSCTVCGKTETETIAKLPHSYGTEWKSDGKNHWHECAVCGLKSELSVHTFGKWTEEKAATCEESGTKVHSCNVCGHTERQETPAVGHKYGDWVVTKAATCTAPGEEIHTCSVCKKTESHEIPQLAHSYGTVWKTDGKNHWHECICGAKSDVAAHTYGDWTETKAATCTTTGSQTHSCTVCGKTETETIAMLPHKYGSEWKHDKTSHWHECSCGARSEESVHAYGPWTVTEAATCIAPGSESHTCSKCKRTESKEIEIDQLAHNMKKVHFIKNESFGMPPHSNVGVEMCYGMKCVNPGCKYYDANSLDGQIHRVSWASGQRYYCSVCALNLPEFSNNNLTVACSPRDLNLLSSNRLNKNKETISGE